MTEKELREIKRRFRPEKSNIPKIVGCFVNGNRQIISKISQPIGLESVVSEKLLGVMKKTLSGSLGTNLTNIEFSTKDVLEGEEHKLLTALVKSKLTDTEALDAFYTKVTESVSFDSNYVILLANDVYDVFSHGSDGEAGDSSEQFSYVICAVCPVKSMPEALSFKEADSLFHAFSENAILASPELGFMFPAFDDRKTNIYGALYYTRSIAENYSDFTEKIFAKEPHMPPKAQRATFNGCLSNVLGDECTCELVRSVHSEISEMIEAHKESHDPEPLVITKATVKNVLAGCGIDDEKLEALDRSFDENFGKGAELSPKNIISANKFEVETPEVKIKIDPAHRDLVTTQVINNVKYLMIRVDGAVEVNGINISIEKE